MPVTTITTSTATDTSNDYETFLNIKTLAVWFPIGFILGSILIFVIFKCYNRKRRSIKPHTGARVDSYYQENAVYWDHALNGIVDYRENTRTQEILIANSRHAGVQTETENLYIDQFEREKTCGPPVDDLENMSVAPPPPLQDDKHPGPIAPKPLRRTSKDDCIRKVPSYRKSHIPSCLQNTWVFNSQDKLSSCSNIAAFVDEAFKDQNSPLHQGQDHYMSVPSIVLIPNQEEAPPSSHEMCRHSYINIKNLSDSSSLNKSQQILVDYENTRVWLSKSRESDLSDDETHIDCRDQKFQDCVRDTLRRKENQSQFDADDQYSAFAGLCGHKKPERPRTGYVVMELTEEVMSFLKVRENKQGKCITSKDVLPENIYYDDRVKNGYLSMHDKP